MNPQDICDTGLSLGLAIRPTTTAAALADRRRPRSPSRKPSLTLSLIPDVGLGAAVAMQRDEAVIRGREEGRPPPPPPPAQQQLPSPCSAASSFVAMTVKKEKEAEAEAEAAERGSSRGSDEEDNGSSARKKLRLTKEQSALLEDRFKEHSTLNPKQKQALAKQLNLRPRQVEVWFQNRRARTKLKQTEVDCEFLKRCYETLTSENLRLQKELQELKALKFLPSSAPPPLYMQFPAATLTMCPSCERMGGGAATTPAMAAAAAAAAAELSGGSAAAGSVVAVPTKTGHFFNPFTHSSAAC